MSTLTALQLAAGTGATQGRATAWLPWIAGTMDQFDIDTPERMAAFLAQVGHESGGLACVREIWGPTTAQIGYEGRKDLGNLRPGDGRRFLGRGLIQLTGRANATAVRDGLLAVMYAPVPNFELSPELLEMPRWAALSAGWFWSVHGLNALADIGAFTLITRRVNGGTNGYPERLALWDAGKQALGVA